MRLAEAISLRPYQLEALDELRGLISRGRRRLVLVAPTGAGKTIMGASVIHSTVARGNRALFLAHRRELIDQTIDKLARFGVRAGVVMASDRRRDDFLPVQVASVATLARRLDRLPPANLIIVDECHHATSESYRKIVDAYADAVVIGMTATPWRSDRIGLADIYEGHVLAATVAQLMEWGALVRYDAFAYDAPDLHSVPMQAGDYNQRELGLACNTGVLVGSVVREYVKHALGRRGVVFAVNVEHSKALVQEFQAAGVRAGHVDCSTPAAERARILGALSTGEMQVVSSVGVLTEGWDCPPAEVGMLARPTKSLPLFVQMVGRLLRPSPETGKARALIHDHSGNLMRHGFVEDERDYALTATPSRVTDLHTCPLCHSIFTSIRDDGSCPKCSELIAPPREQREAAERRQKEQIEGERLAAEEIRARRAEAAGSASRAEKAAEYLRLKEMQERKGYKEGWIGVRFRALFGHYPSFSVAELTGIKPARVPFSRRVA